MLKELCNATCVSGYEKDFVLKLISELQNVPHDEMYQDSVGNLVFVSRGHSSKKRIMITAHIDEVGFQVIKASSSGYRIKPLGSIKTNNAVSERVVSKDTQGLISCENESSLSSYSYNLLELHVDQGIAKTGDVFTFIPNFVEQEKCYVSKALDNRVGCYCLIELMRANVTHADDIYFVFTVQEEIGMRGARVARTQIKPDILLNIDATPVLEMNSVLINEGVGIKVSDGAIVADPDFVNNLVSIAEQDNIPYQLEVNDYGGNEMIITNETDNGCSLLGLSIPCENMHSARSRVGKKDIEACINLLIAFVKNRL